MFIQNLAPGAAARAGFDAAELRARHPRLVTCDISGYGDRGPYARMKSYALLVQADTGLAPVTGRPPGPGRGGVRGRERWHCRDGAVASLGGPRAARRGGMVDAVGKWTGAGGGSQSLRSDHQRFINAAPLLAGTEVFAGSFGHFARIRAIDGLKHWGRRWGSDLTGFGSPATDGTLVVVAGLGKSSSLRAVHLNGAVVWEYGARGLHGSPVIAGNAVLFTDYEGEIVRVNLDDGELVWRSPLGGNRSASTPAVKDEIVVAGGVGRIRAFDLTDGRLLWDVATRRSALTMAPYDSQYGALVGSPTISGGTVYVPFGDGWLYAIDLTSGTVLWEMDFGRPILSAPCIAGGFLYLSTFDGHVYAFAPEQQCAADCDSSTGFGVLDIFDFLCFQHAFVTADPYACDCDTSTGQGVCDIFDFLCFQDAFVAGCP